MSPNVPFCPRSFHMVWERDVSKCPPPITHLFGDLHGTPGWTKCPGMSLFVPSHIWTLQILAGADVPEMSLFVPRHFRHVTDWRVCCSAWVPSLPPSSLKPALENGLAGRTCCFCGKPMPQEVDQSRFGKLHCLLCDGSQAAGGVACR